MATDWNKLAACDAKVNTTALQAWWCDLEDWKTYKLAETVTLTANKYTAFPVATPAFLKNIAVGKDSNFAAASNRMNVEGQTVYNHTATATLFPQTAEDFDSLNEFAACKRVVLILEREPIEGNGSFIVLGDTMGIECTGEDGFVASLSDGFTKLIFKTNTENKRYENGSLKVIHVTDYETTKAAILANVVAPA